MKIVVTDDVGNKFDLLQADWINGRLENLVLKDKNDKELMASDTGVQRLTIRFVKES